MAEGGMSADDILDELLKPGYDEERKPDDQEENEEFLNLSEAASENIHQQEEELPQYTGNDLVSQREQLSEIRLLPGSNKSDL